MLAVVALAGCGQPPAPRIYTLADLPVTEWTLGLPVTGDGKLIVMVFPRDVTDWRRVTGFVDFTCDGCTLGDDEAQIDVDVWGEHGIEFGHITFDEVHARADFAGGTMKLVARWRSRDMTLDATVKGTLAPDGADTVLDGCVTFAPTDALMQRSPKMHALVSSTGAPMREDGKFTIRIEGPLRSMRKLAKLCDAAG